MITRTLPARSGRRTGLRTAAAVALAAVAVVSAEARPAPPPGPPVTALVEDGIPGKGLPPTPGPTNPNGP